VWFKEVVKSLLEKALRKRGFFMVKYPKRGKPMLVIVQTTGSAMVPAYTGGTTPYIQANTPTLCRLSAFIEYKVKTGHLKVLAENVPEGTENVEAYLESLKPKADPVKPQVSKTKKST